MTAFKLSSLQMAHFVAKGYLRFDGIVPAQINEQFMTEAGHVDAPAAGSDRQTLQGHYAKLMASNEISEVVPGTPLADAYPANSALARLFSQPDIDGAITSLVGLGAVLDHHFLHITFPPAYYGEPVAEQVSQHTHQDSTIDPRQAFDVQIFYFPHAVSAEMGGTRFVPGTHLRIVSEAAIARYQNIRGQQHVVCPPGTLLFMHHGIWHGGGLNRSDRVRYMFKVRLNPTVRQTRLWNTDDLDAQHFAQDPIFFVKRRRDRDAVHSILTTPEPWFENDTGRLEYINRIRLWRHLLGNEQFDADYWMTRVENEPS